MRLSVTDSHFRQVCKRHDLPRHKFREFHFSPGVSFALLIERNGVRFATRFLSVLFTAYVVVDPPAAGADWPLKNSSDGLLPFFHRRLVPVSSDLQSTQIRR